MINVIGLGYIGLPTSLILASHGIEIIGTDHNNKIIEKLNKGEVTFKENGLDALFQQAKKSGIVFTSAYQKADIYIIAVPTPYDKKSKKVDPSYVIEAVKNITNVCENNTIIIIESTVSPGTIDRNVRPIINEFQLKTKFKIHLVHAPERIIPGNMIYELKHNSRTIGADQTEIAEKVKKLYASFCKGTIMTTDIRTAEMSKIVENTFRDINIAYANELAKICRSDNMDVYEIIKIANQHPRVNILSPGPGVGGHCISVDPWFLVGDYPGLANIILSARKINDSMPEFVLHRIYDIMMEKGLKNVERVGLYGLTYKENVDDIRESPTMQLLEHMDHHLAGGRVKVFDPYVTENLVPNQYDNFDYFIQEIDMIVIMVAHDSLFSKVKFLRNKIIFDTRHTGKLESSQGVYYL